MLRITFDFTAVSIYKLRLFVVFRLCGCLSEQNWTPDPDTSAGLINIYQRVSMLYMLTQILYGHYNNTNYSISSYSEYTVNTFN